MSKITSPLNKLSEKLNPPPAAVASAIASAKPSPAPASMFQMDAALLAQSSRPLAEALAAIQKPAKN
jgi:hypothetical protein